MDRSPATNFTYLRNSNISYFVGMDAAESNATMILGGDRNITNGTAVRNGVIEMTTSHPGSWTREMHKNVGNILMTDISVQQVDSIRNFAIWRQILGLATNRLQMP